MENRLPKIERWSTCHKTTGMSPYMAPELAPIKLQGAVYGHHGHDDGTFVVTSRIVSIAIDRWGHMVTTRSGSRYRLGVPDDGWIGWLEFHGKPFDPDNPIRFVDG